MSTLARSFRHDSGTLSFLLDEVLRRGLISVTSAADWLTERRIFDTEGDGNGVFQVQEGNLFNLLRDPRAYEMWESVVDRTIDFVRAAIGQRKELGGSMVMDEFMDLSPAPITAPSSANAATSNGSRRPHPTTLSDEPEGSAEDFLGGGTDGAGGLGGSATAADDLEVDYTEDVEDEDEDRDGRRRTRFRTGDGSYIETSSEARGAAEGVAEAGSEGESAVLAAAALIGQQRGQRQQQQTDDVQDDDEAEDPVLVYSELVKQAIANARRVFRTLVGALVETHGRVNEAGVTFWQTLCSSLLRRVLIAFADAEKLLSFQHQQRIVLTERRSRVENLLSGSRSESESAGEGDGDGRSMFVQLLEEIYRD